MTHLTTFWMAIAVFMMPLFAQCELGINLPTTGSPRGEMGVESADALYPMIIQGNDQYSLLRADEVSASGFAKDVDNYSNKMNQDTADWFGGFGEPLGDEAGMYIDTTSEATKASPTLPIQRDSFAQGIGGTSKFDKADVLRALAELGRPPDPGSSTGLVSEKVVMGLAALGGLWMLIQNRRRRGNSEL